MSTFPKPAEVLQDGAYIQLREQSITLLRLYGKFVDEQIAYTEDARDLISTQYSRLCDEARDNGWLADTSFKEARIDDENTMYIVSVSIQPTIATMPGGKDKDKDKDKDKGGDEDVAPPADDEGDIPPPSDEGDVPPPSA